MRKSIPLRLTPILLFCGGLFCCGSLRADIPPVDVKLLQLPSSTYDLVWDATRSLFFVSCGTAILVIDPESASIEDRWELGVIADKIAISSDGQFLYASIRTRGSIQRFRIQDRRMDLEIPLGQSSNGQNRLPGAIVVLPGQPQSILVAFLSTGDKMTVYDGSAARPGTAAVNLNALYLRSSNNTIYGSDGNGQIYSFAVDARGVAIARTMPVQLNPTGTLCWNGNLVADFAGAVFDLDAGIILGTAAFGKNAFTHYPAIPDPNGQTLNTLQTDANESGTLVQYSLANFRATGMASLTRDQSYQIGAGDFSAVPRVFGGDGVAIANNGHSTAAFMGFFHWSGVAPIPPSAPLKPTVDGSGAIHVPLPANGVVFDPNRNRIWATIPGLATDYGNSVISLDTKTGNLSDVLPAGSEPGPVALSGDSSHLYTALLGSPAVSTFDLSSLQPGPRLTSQDAAGNTLIPVSIAAIANQSNSVAILAVSRITAAALTQTWNLQIFDGVIPREHAFTGGIGVIYPGDGDNSLYSAATSYTYGDGSQDGYVLRFDDHGFTENKPIKLFIGPGPLVYSDGKVFTGVVQSLTPDFAHINGTFAAAGTAIPFPQRNLVAVVGTSSVTTFDLATFRPLASYPFTGPITSAARIGNEAVAIATKSEILIVPLTGLTPWPAPPIQMTTAAPGIRRVNLQVNAINAIPGTNKLALSIPSSAGVLGNSIAVFNADSGKIESSAFVGSEPTMIRTSAAGSAVYAYLSGENRIGRFNIGSGSADLIFTPDPLGGSTQYPLADMALGPDEGLTLSYVGGWLATFDNGVLRPNVDKNTEGPGAFSGAPYIIALNPAGTIVYAFDDYWSIQDFRRDTLTANGLQWTSGTYGLISAPVMQPAGGLLFTSRGTVIDPERTREVGRFALPFGDSGLVAPDLAAGRVYFFDGQLKIFDSSTYAMLANWTIPFNTGNALDLVRFGSDGLALRSLDEQLYLISIAAIPLLPTPVPSPQTSLPATPGVVVLDLATNDIAYDASRDRIYASVPNSEAANGDRIVSIDPSNGVIVEGWQTATNPKVLALSDDRSQLYFSSGSEGFGFFSGFSPTPESIRGLNPGNGAMTSGFPYHDPLSDFSYGLFDLASIPGSPGSVASIEYVTESAGGGVGTSGGSLRIYDNGVSRDKYLRPHIFSCNYLVAGSSPSRLYCSDGATITRLAADAQGVSELDSFPLLPGRGPFGHMVFRDGRIYTTTGLVLDAEGKRVISRLKTQGPVAIDGNLISWLDPSTFSQAKNSVTLRAFDAASLQPVSTKEINVTAADSTRLVACGQGRVAFRAGQEIYIVTP